MWKISWQADVLWAPQEGLSSCGVLVMPKIQAVKLHTYVVPENEATQNSNVDCRQVQASRSGPPITEEGTSENYRTVW